MIFIDAGDEQRPAERRVREQDAGEQRRGGRREAARDVGDARRGGPLVGRARPPSRTPGAPARPSGRTSARTSSSAIATAPFGANAASSEADVRREVGEHHRADEPDASRRGAARGAASSRRARRRRRTRARSCPAERSKRRWSHSTSSDVTTNPLPAESRLNSPASSSTVRRDVCSDPSADARGIAAAGAPSGSRRSGGRRGRSRPPRRRVEDEAAALGVGDVPVRPVGERLGHARHERAERAGEDRRRGCRPRRGAGGARASTWPATKACSVGRNTLTSPADGLSVPTTATSEQRPEPGDGREADAGRDHHRGRREQQGPQRRTGAR